MASRSYLVLDIETVLDPALPIAEPTETERLPPPPHHQVVVLGVLWLDHQYAVKRLGIVGDGQDEVRALVDFAKFLDSHQPDVVTFNGRSFDLPVIASRCMRHGIPLRYYYQRSDVRYRYSDGGHLDLLDFVCDFGASRRSTLDVMARLCGMPGKVGIDGKDVGPMVHAGRLEEVKNYCLCDVVQTAAVFLRVQLVRGALPVEEYRVAANDLVELIDSDDRLTAVRDGVDRPIFLLDKGAVS